MFGLGLLRLRSSVSLSGRVGKQAVGCMNLGLRGSLVGDKP